MVGGRHLVIFHVVVPVLIFSGEKRNICRFFVGKPEGKRSLGRLTL
jgi:hypothetical protein